MSVGVKQLQIKSHKAYPTMQNNKGKKKVAYCLVTSAVEKQCRLFEPKSLDGKVA